MYTTSTCYAQFRPILLLVLFPFIGGISCSKSSFLDKKPNTDFVIPTTMSDFQSLLDNDAVFGRTSALGELSSDNLYLQDSFWQGLDFKEHNAYVWSPGDIFDGQGQQDDWDIPYQQVFYANVVLEGLGQIKQDTTNRQEWNALEGAALFLRGYAFYNLAQLFAPVYDSGVASTSEGIPLRLSSDVNPVSVRATLQQTYSQILTDVLQASRLLPSTIPAANLNRPSKPAALALLARIYLSMGAYEQAGNYADSCLILDAALIDYNSLNSSIIIPFPPVTSEILYQSSFFTGVNQSIVALLYPKCMVDSTLYASYLPGDLRTKLYYKSSGPGLTNIKGSYTGNIYPFSGLATDEVYLVQAECRARAGQAVNAMTSLNTLLKNRWSKDSTFVPQTAASPAEALKSVLLERRKELAFRGLRWTDLRRLNKENANIILSRRIFGQSFQLLPASPLYVLPIPPDVIALSGMPQNPRPQQ